MEEVERLYELDLTTEAGCLAAAAEIVARESRRVKAAPDTLLRRIQQVVLEALRRIGVMPAILARPSLTRKWRY